MPIIIHNREATEDILDLLEEENAKEVGGIMHCYNDAAKYVERCLNMNFYISFGGTVTFKNAPLPKEAAAEVPLDKLLVETDAPFLAPHPNRGKRNEPAYVKFVAEKLAEIKECPLEEIEKVTTQNAFQVFRLEH